METEFKSLEQKLNQVVELCQRLRTDNQELRQQLATALNENKQLADKIGTASDRLESLLSQLPEDDA
jgi:cell division protein ZapB